MVPLNKNKSGFALLMSLIVVSVVISIGLSVLDLTLKQLRLSTNSKDSETAFHAANAGLECARYWREVDLATMELGQAVSPNCFNASAVNVSPSAVTVVSAGDAYLYDMDFTWGVTGAIRCSQISTLVMVSDTTATTTIDNTVNPMDTLIPGYPYGTTKECEPGGRCSVISVRGYSRDCANISLPGTVEREVLLEL